jgi:hypothetical protein
LHTLKNFRWGGGFRSFCFSARSTFLQTTVTYASLLCFRLLNSVYGYGLPISLSNRANSRSHSSSTDMSSRNGSGQTGTLTDYLVPRFGSARTTFLETFALSISVAAAGVLSAYTLSFAPFEIFLFWRSFTIPVLIEVTLYLATKEAVPSKAIFPAEILCLGMLMAAYRPNLPQSPNAIWAAALSSLFAAFWPFQLKRALWSPSECS